MTFSANQIKELEAPLSRSRVKDRSQGGRTFSYVEGWHVIAEANRIFGFDGWSRETVDIRCVSEKPRDIGASKVPGFGVTYICKVRVVVQGIAREGCGSGHGIDRDLGQAHESALKEAETDAMKRALMTFGNTFGLALYDKDQANVEDAVRLPKKDANPLYKAMESAIRACKTTDELKSWQASNKSNIESLPADWVSTLRIEYGDKLAELQQ